MFNVASKPHTYRVAKAQAIVNIHPNTSILIREGKSPKGDIVESARVSATLGAKKTSDLIPYCHPIPIDHVNTQVIVKFDCIEVEVEVKSIWKTGMEMEALTGACIGALTIYDMLKPVDNTLSISSIKLLHKSGGLKDFSENGKRQLRAAIIVISDSVAKGKRHDKSGKYAVQKLQERGIDVVEYIVVSDDSNIIEDHLKKYCDDIHADLILTIGGTGIGPRDVTPEATKKVLEKELRGISEASRAYGQQRTPLSMFSRGLSGLRGSTLIVNMPGSLKGVSEYLDFLFPGIEHAFNMMEGQGH
jgi:molybdenum cofactor biosynthesis protein MoaC